jgi:hypothetical protein
VNHRRTEINTKMSVGLQTKLIRRGLMPFMTITGLVRDLYFESAD